MYVLDDGSPVFLSLAPGSNPPSQEDVQRFHDDLRAKRAARSPEAIAYGDALRKQRLTLNVSLRDLGCTTGIGAVNLSKIENGYRLPTDQEQQAINDVLGVTP